MATLVTTTVRTSGGDYTSLSAWEAAQQGNLVSLDEIHQADCAGFTDTTAVTINGSTTDSTRYMQVTGDNDTGAWQTSGYYILGSTGTPVISIQDGFTLVEDVQVQMTSNTGSQFGIAGGTGADSSKIERCIIYKSGTGGSSNGGISANFTGDFFVSNSVVWWGGSAGTGSAGITAAKTSSGLNMYVHNCTVDSNGRLSYNYGISFASSMTLKNSIGDNGGTGFSTGTFNSNSNYNSTDAGTASGGANDRVSQTFTFTDAANGDYRITSGDGGAKDFGTDLSGDANYPISVDITNTTRTGTWDIGAYEVISAAGTTYTGWYSSKGGWW